MSSGKGHGTAYIEMNRPVRIYSRATTDQDGIHRTGTGNIRFPTVPGATGVREKFERQTTRSIRCGGAEGHGRIVLGGINGHQQGSGSVVPVIYIQVISCIIGKMYGCKSDQGFQIGIRTVRTYGHNRMLVIQIESGISTTIVKITRTSTDGHRIRCIRIVGHIIILSPQRT